jgi:hypothetical protein
MIDRWYLNYAMWTIVVLSGSDALKNQRKHRIIKLDFVE